PLPLVVGGAAGIDEDPVVRSAALARVGVAWGAGAEDAAVAVTLGRLPPQQLAAVGDPREVDDRLLHGDFDALAPPGNLALEERSQDANRRVQPGAGIANGWARLKGTLTGLASGGEGTADRLRDHVEAKEVAVRPLWRKPLDLSVDDLR